MKKENSNKKLRAYRKDNNLCIVCGHGFESASHAECKEKRNKKLRQERNERTAAGLCTTCGFSFDSLEHEQCREYRRSFDNKRCEERKNAGMCTTCGEAFDSSIHEACKEKQRLKIQARTTGRIESGNCTSCGVKINDGKKLCEDCWFKSISNSTFGTNQYYVQLKEIWARQNSLDYYTGELLIRNGPDRAKSASIDHLVPRSRGGADDVKNTVFTAFEVNEMKKRMTRPEFLAHCLFVFSEFDTHPQNDAYFDICAKVVKHHGLSIVKCQCGLIP